MEKSTKGFYVDLPDWDTPIFRIFQWKFFEDFLKTKELCLVKPQMWDDPFEFLTEWIVVESRDGSDRQQLSLAGKLPTVFGQSWSKTEHSDTLQRAYSRVQKDPDTLRNLAKNEEGIKVKTSPRKLMAAIERALINDSGKSVFIGAVRYKAQNDVAQHVVNLVGRAGVNGLLDARLSASALLVKRNAFSHESEIRLIIVDKKTDHSESLLRISVDPQAVIDGLMLDPRLPLFERLERQQELESWGYRGLFDTPDLYQRTIFKVPVPGSWFQ